jgi:RNA polymerase sigma-70 factor (ECF subfamily)
MSRAQRPRQPIPAPEGRVFHLPLPESDAGLVAALRAGREDAREEVVRRCTPDVERVLYRVLGPDSEIEDVAHDVFMVAFTSLDQLQKPHALRSWLVGIAIRKVRKLIQRRKRWRFVLDLEASELPEPEIMEPAEMSEVMRSTYRILSNLPVDDRVALALRYMGEMDLVTVAEVTGVSLATAKRRIARGHRRFVELASKSDILAPWLDKEALES